MILSWHRFIFIVALLFWALLIQKAHAQPSGARGNDFMYKVVPDDTLIKLATTYTDNPQHWPTLQALNQVADPYALTIGRFLRIPFALIPELPSSATVTHLIGSASLNGITLKFADVVREGDTITTAHNGYLTLTLEDNSTSSVIADSTMHIERLRTFKGTGLLDAIFSLKQGSIESAVAPKNTGVGRFEIRTPISITGVRGTQLRVHTNEQRVITEVIVGAAQQGSGAVGDTTIRQGQGAGVNANGEFLGVRNLLSAPVPHPLAPGTSNNVIRFDPVPGAIAYVVQVARDPDGTQPISKKMTTEPQFTVSASGVGMHYAFIRAIDTDGVMGHDAIVSFNGQAVLHSANGLAVVSGSGDPVRLNLY